MAPQVREDEEARAAGERGADAGRVDYRPGERDDSRPWGFWEVLDVVDRPVRVAVKRIGVKPGAILSDQRHRHRRELWVIVKGRARIYRQGPGDPEQRTEELSAFATAVVEPGVWHRIENIGTDMLEFVEVQTGPVLDEEDIERRADVYGRAGS